jgi:hypothetical protein
VAWDFGDFRIEWLNVPLSDFYNDLTCEGSFVVDADISLENGGAFSGVFSVAYDENCCPKVSDVKVTYEVDDLEDFPGGCDGEVFLNDFGGECIEPVVEVEGCAECEEEEEQEEENPLP